MSQSMDRQIGMGENSRNHMRPQGPMGARWDGTTRDHGQ